MRIGCAAEIRHTKSPSFPPAVAAWCRIIWARLCIRIERTGISRSDRYTVRCRVYGPTRTTLRTWIFGLAQIAERSGSPVWFDLYGCVCPDKRLIFASRWSKKTLADFWHFELHSSWLCFCGVRADNHNSAQPSKRKPARAGRWVIYCLGFLTTFDTTSQSTHSLAARP